MKYHNSLENTTDKKLAVDGKAEFYKMLYSHNTLKNISLEFDRDYKFRNSSALVSFAKGLLYDKPSVPVKLVGECDASNQEAYYGRKIKAR